MLLFEFVGELFQFEAREPEFDESSQRPPNSTALSIWYVEPRPPVLAVQLAAAAPPPNSAPHTHKLPVASMTPHLLV